VATANEHSGYAAVVDTTRPPTIIRITPVTDTLVMGQFVQLSATAFDTTGAVVPNVALTWSSADTTIASVSTTGGVWALRAGGPVRIVASVNRLSSYAVVVDTAVKAYVTEVSPAVAKLRTNTFFCCLKAVAFVPSLGYVPGPGVLQIATFTWSSSDPNIASVSLNGFVHARQAGTAWITATVNDLSPAFAGTAKVVVSNPCNPFVYPHRCP
jgi:uncharacterized protein YjdB